VSSRWWTVKLCEEIVVDEERLNVLRQYEFLQTIVACVHLRQHRRFAESNVGDVVATNIQELEIRQVGHIKRAETKMRKRSA
jgi:hypothetical protein